MPTKNRFTETNLETKLYTPFKDKILTNTNPESYIRSYQKRISDRAGKKYYINFNEFKHFVTPEHSSFSSNCQFTTKDGKTVDVEYHIGSETTIEEVEGFYEDMWTKMEFQYYERWDY